MSVVRQIKQDLRDVREKITELQRREQRLVKALEAVSSAYGNGQAAKTPRTAIWQQVEDGSYTREDANFFTQDQRDDALQLVMNSQPFTQEDVKNRARDPKSDLDRRHPAITNTSRLIGSMLFHKQIEVVKRQTRNAEYRMVADVPKYNRPKAEAEEPRSPTKAQVTKPGATRAAVDKLMADHKPRTVREVGEALGKNKEQLYKILYGPKYAMTTEPRKDPHGRTYQMKVFRLKRREHGVHVGSGPTEVREGRLV